MPKPSLLRLSEVDVTQKIIEVLSNVCMRAVLFSVRDEAKDTNQVAGELNLSPSTVYKSFATLEYLTLVEVDSYRISDDGKKTKMYRSRISKVEIVMESNVPMLHLAPNTGGLK